MVSVVNQLVAFELFLLFDTINIVKMYSYMDVFSFLLGAEWLESWKTLCLTLGGSFYSDHATFHLHTAFELLTSGLVRWLSR